MMREPKLKGKKALVTASGQGLGYASALHLLKEGAEVLTHSFQTPLDREAMAKDAGVDVGRIHYFSGDLTDREAVQERLGGALEELGGLDILVNNAGSLVGRRQVGEVDEDFLRYSEQLNLDSMVWVSQVCESRLREAGSRGGASVINLASLAGRKGGHGGSLIYSSLKGAVLTYTRALASEWSEYGIRVNAIAPGFILGSRFHAEHTTEESAKQTIAGIPLGRAGNPDDIARCVVYLAGEYGGFITGATIDINGGVYAC